MDHLSDMIDPDTLIKEMSIAHDTLYKSEVILTDLLRNEGLSERHIKGGLSYYRLNLSRFEKYLNDPRLAVGPIINNIKNSQDKPIRPDTDDKYSGDVDKQIKNLCTKWCDMGVSDDVIRIGLKMLDKWIEKVS